MTRTDWIIAGLCFAWLGSLGWVDLNASPEFIAALNGDHAADWMQVLVGVVGVIATVSAIYFSVRAGFLHQDRARAIANAEALTSAYLLARIAGAAVIHGDRWARGAARAPSRRLEDQDEMLRYPAAWDAWTEGRLAGYIENLTQIDVTNISDIRFISDVLTVRTRAEWYRKAVGPVIGDQPLPADVQRRLGWAARDVMKSLALMRQKASDLRRVHRLSPIDVDPFPESNPPFSGPEDRAKWIARTAAA